jgi:hypothetical protein
MGARRTLSSLHSLQNEIIKLVITDRRQTVGERLEGSGIVGEMENDQVLN